MSREDEIMARHLLAGGKMLSKTCPECGCPLFEIKGETLCVVCAEESKEPDRGQPLPEMKNPAIPVSPEAANSRSSIPGSVPVSPPVFQSLEDTILHLCLRIRQEDDPEKALLLMRAVRKGCKSLALLARSGDQG